MQLAPGRPPARAGRSSSSRSPPPWSSRTTRAPARPAASGRCRGTAPPAPTATRPHARTRRSLLPWARGVGCPPRPRGPRSPKPCARAGPTQESARPSYPAFRARVKRARMGRSSGSRREGCSARALMRRRRRRRGLTLRRTPGMFLGFLPFRARRHAPIHRTTSMSAQQFVVQGGHTLSGRIRPSGNKNAALPIVAASLLCEEPVHLENVPRIRDVETLVDLIKSIGAEAEWTARNALTIHAKQPPATELDPALCRKIRASILLAGPLLARCGEIELPPPGGDVIGRRRVDTHFLALQQLGATFQLDDAFILRAQRLRGADVFLDEPSVTATENALAAAVAADGTTVLRNAASEPHVQDLARFLVAMGASIDGIGTNTVTIHGGRPL